jgi:hypothetical protein
VKTILVFLTRPTLSGLWCAEIKTADPTALRENATVADGGTGAILRAEIARPPSHTRRTISTFSRDIARSVSPWSPGHQRHGFQEKSGSYRLARCRR